METLIIALYQRNETDPKSSVPSSSDVSGSRGSYQPLVRHRFFAGERSDSIFWCGHLRRRLPLPNIVVDAEISYSDSLNIPVPFSGNEKHRKVSATTDVEGNFEFVNETGYSFNILAFKRGGVSQQFSGKPPYPRSTFQLNDLKDGRRGTIRNRMIFPLDG